MRIEYIIIIFQIVNVIIKTEIIEKCEIGNYCGSTPCSVNGYCDFDLTKYNNDLFFESTDNELKCFCNKGYSSYDITNLKNLERTIFCCYKQKSHLTAFYLELFIGFGIGHFYIGNINFGLIKFFSQIFLCFFFWCMIYFVCKKEHTVVLKLNEEDKKEIENYALGDKNKMKEISEIKEVSEEYDENALEEKEKEEKNSNNESKNQSSEDEEENKIEEIISEDLIKCPKSKFFIIASFIAFVLFQLIDIVLMGSGIHKDKHGEDLNMWN